MAIYFAPSESTFATTDANEGRPSDPLCRTVSQTQLWQFLGCLRGGVDGVTTHDHRRVLRIGQERYRPGVRNGVNSAKFDVDFKANIRKVLWLGSPALATLQALSRYSNLEGFISRGEWMGANVTAYANITETVGRVEEQLMNRW